MWREQTAASVLTRVRTIVNVCKVKTGYEGWGRGGGDVAEANALPLTFHSSVFPFFFFSPAFWPSHSCSTHSCGGLEAESRSSSRGSLEELSQPQPRSAGAAKQKVMLDYGVYMAKYVQPHAPTRSPTGSESPGQSPQSSPQTTKKVGNSSRVL